MQFDSSSIINLPRAPQGPAQPKAWSFTICPTSPSQRRRLPFTAELAHPCWLNISESLPSGMSSQGSLVWNTHILNWGATSSSNKTWQPAWLQGREEKWNYLSNIFQCSWLHPNLILEFFSEMNSYMPNMLRARDKLLLILLHANLDPKTVSLDINPRVYHVTKQIDNKLRYTMVYRCIQHISHIALISVAPPSAHPRSMRPLPFQQSPGMPFDYALPGNSSHSNKAARWSVNCRTD